LERVYGIFEIIMKLSFSAVLFQLFLIVLCAEEGMLYPSYLFEMLEVCAASCTVALGGACFTDYILKNEG